MTINKYVKKQLSNNNERQSHNKYDDDNSITNETNAGDFIFDEGILQKKKKWK